MKQEWREIDGGEDRTGGIGKQMKDREALNKIKSFFLAREKLKRREEGYPSSSSPFSKKRKKKKYAYVHIHENNTGKKQH